MSQRGVTRRSSLTPKFSQSLATLPKFNAPAGSTRTIFVLIGLDSKLNLWCEDKQVDLPLLLVPFGSLA